MTALDKRLLQVLVGAFAIGCFSIALLAASEAPGISIAQTGYNFGELSEMTPLAHDFIVRNTGKSVLNINDVKPS